MILSLRLLLVCLAILSSHQEECVTTCCEDLPPRTDSTPMKYIFYQDTARFIGGENEFYINTTGYSGIAGEARNNPKMECAQFTGPPPATTYKIDHCQNIVVNPLNNETYPAPCSFAIEPLDPSKVCDRPGFFVHGCASCSEGDTTVPPQDGCSLGCIVIAIQERRKLRVGDIIEVRNYEKSEFKEKKEL